MEEGTLIAWHKAEGDAVAAGDILAEIETDKATMEVEAVDEGVLGKILVAAGTENVKINATIAFLLTDGEDASNLDAVVSIDGADGSPPEKTSESVSSGAEAREASPAASPSIESASSAAAPVSTNTNERVIASPLARRLAAQQNLDLTTVSGSGPKGRIIQVDVERAALGGGKPSPSVGQASAPLTPAPLTPQDIEAGFTGFEPPYDEVKLTSVRKVIAQRLVASKQEVPHFYLTLSCQIDRLLEVRSLLNETSEFKISVNDLMIGVVAKALRKVPEVNAAWAGQSIRLFKQVDVAVAVATQGGLITPIIRQADTKPLDLISKEMKELAIRAREGKLKPHEFQGGTFSISNLGMFGISHFQAIVNPPQAAILAIGAGEKQAVIDGDIVEIATMMQLTLSVDHRVIDGALAATFLKEIKKMVEEPARLLI
eukprot:g8546.t1